MSTPRLGAILRIGVPEPDAQGGDLVEAIATDLFVGWTHVLSLADPLSQFPAADSRCCGYREQLYKQV
jgi:hypothetical protein